jgi:hypothetical protein
MPWLLWVLRLWVIALLYWWGTILLLKVPVPSREGRERDARWVREQAAGRQKHGPGAWRLTFTDALVYLALASVLLGALAWVLYGFWRG